MEGCLVFLFGYISGFFNINVPLRYVNSTLNVEVSWNMDPAFRSLDPGIWILEPGSRILDPGSRIIWYVNGTLNLEKVR